MTVERWLAAAVEDVRARGLEGAVPVLEAFARSMTTLRSAEWNANPAPAPVVGGDDSSSMSPRLVDDSGTARTAPAARPGVLDEATALDISTASERLRTRTLTSVALTDRCLEQISRLDGALNAFITVTRDEALAAARTADAEIARGEWRGPLHGIPISLKDLIDQRGVATTAGSHARDRVDAVRDAPVTAALREAGAVLVGKTNLHEF